MQTANEVCLMDVRICEFPLMEHPVRTGLVITDPNKSDSCLVVPFTSQWKDYSFQQEIPGDERSKLLKPGFACLRHYGYFSKKYLSQRRRITNWSESEYSQQLYRQVCSEFDQFIDEFEHPVHPHYLLPQTRDQVLRNRLIRRHYDLLSVGPEQRIFSDPLVREELRFWQSTHLR
jgi:hypothetical protein